MARWRDSDETEATSIKTPLSLCFSDPFRDYIFKIFGQPSRLRNL